METKVLIGIPTGEFGRRADFYDYLNQLDKRAGTMVMSVHGQSPARSRNLIIEQAIINNCSHILFLDDDTAFKPDLLEQLLAHGKDIVTGLCFMRKYPHQPLIFDDMDELGGSKFCFLKGDEPSVIKIVAAGLGCILIKTSVFDKLEKPWIRLGELETDHWCDDIGFFKRLRDVGVESYCDLNCRVGHIGSVIIWPQKNETQWFSGYDTGGQEVVGVPQLRPDLIMENGILNAISIEGWMTHNELMWIASKSRNCKLIIEFGSHCGRSTRAMGDNTDGQVYAVDPWDGRYTDMKGLPISVLGGSRWFEFHRNMKDLIDSGTVVPCRSTSKDFKLNNGRRADLVFIDADHRIDSVYEDIDIAKKLINSNGIIAGHDYNHPDWPGVKEAVDKVFGDKVNLHDTIWWVQNA